MHSRALLIVFSASLPPLFGLSCYILSRIVQDGLFGLSCYISGRIVQGSRVSLQGGHPHLAILLAGPFGRKMVGPLADTTKVYATAFYDHMVAPLLPQFRVAVMIASEPNDTRAWETWCQGFHDNITVRINVSAPLPARDTTIFSKDKCRSKDGKNHCNTWWLQYGHLRSSYELMKQHEAEHNLHFDYIVKGRVDFMYKPDNFLLPGWFLKMGANDVAVPSTEFHNHRRWMEATKGHPSAWPSLMADQIAFGPRLVMDKYFELLWSKATFSTEHGIEGILAAHAIYHNLRPVTVEFQVSQPGGGALKFQNGKGGHWVTTNCTLCMTP